MALDKSGSGNNKVSDLADARRERLDKSSIAYGRRRGDDPGGPNKQAHSETSELQADSDKPNVRQVPASGGRKFDRQKVDRIKAELASGQYEINPLQIADLFIDHERHC